VLLLVNAGSGTIKVDKEVDNFKDETKKEIN